MKKKSPAQPSIGQPRPPRYCLHRPSGQAAVYVHGQMVYLGPYGEPESLRRYEQLVARWRIAGPAAAAERPADREHQTVLDLVEQFLAWGVGRYTRAPQEISAYGVATKRLLRLHADTPLHRFGPLALQQVRSAMVADGLARSVVNAAVHRLRRIWRWGVQHELLHESLWNALKSVTALSAGEQGVREREPVAPASWRQLRAVLQKAPPMVRVMVRVQILTGMRPGELVRLRPADLVQAPTGWLYWPGRHKSQHHGKSRVVLIGPRAQSLLAPVLAARIDQPDAPLFQPADALADAAARKTAERRGQYAGRYAGRRLEKARQAGRRPRQTHPGYTVAAYRRAIQRACEAVWPLPAELARRPGEPAQAWRARLGADGMARVTAWRSEHGLHPHQLRHSFATRVGNRFGDEAAQKLLGHSRLATTAIYVQRDIRAGRRVIDQVG